MKKLLIALAFTGILSGAQAEPASEASVKKLMEVTGVNELSRKMFDRMMGSFKQLMPLAPAEFWEIAEKEVDIDELINEMIPLYQKNLQQNEIEAVIAFYETPEGKAFIAAQPKITQGSMQIGQQWGLKLGQKITEKYKANHQKKTDNQ